MNPPDLLRRIRIPYVEDLIERSLKRGVLMSVAGYSTRFDPSDPVCAEAREKAESFIDEFERRHHEVQRLWTAEERAHLVSAFSLTQMFIMTRMRLEEGSYEAEQMTASARLMTHTLLAHLAYAAAGRVTHVLEPEIQTMFLEGDMGKLKVKDLIFTTSSFYLALPDSRLRMTLQGGTDVGTSIASVYGITLMQVDPSDENYEITPETRFKLTLHYRITSMLDDEGNETGALPDRQSPCDLDGVLSVPLPFGGGQALSYIEAQDLSCESILWDHLHPSLLENFSDPCVLGILEATSIVFGVLAYTTCENADIVPFDTERYEVKRAARLARAKSTKARRKIERAEPTSGNARIRLIAPAIARVLREKADRGATGRTVRPHLRTGHFNTYYVGKRKREDGTVIPLEERETVRRFIPPQIVGTGTPSDSMRVLT